MLNLLNWKRWWLYSMLHRTSPDRITFRIRFYILSWSWRYQATDLKICTGIVNPQTVFNLKKASALENYYCSSFDQLPSCIQAAHKWSNLFTFVTLLFELIEFCSTKSSAQLQYNSNNHKLKTWRDTLLLKRTDDLWTLWQITISSLFHQDIPIHQVWQ